MYPSLVNSLHSYFAIYLLKYYIIDIKNIMKISFISTKIIRSKTYSEQNSENTYNNTY